MNFGKLSKFAMALTIGATLAACGNGDEAQLQKAVRQQKAQLQATIS